MSRSSDIKEKRDSLGITIKEFSDALGYDSDGEKRLRLWEKGQEDVPDDEYQRIMLFATITPYFPLYRPFRRNRRDTYTVSGNWRKMCFYK